MPAGTRTNHRCDRRCQRGPRKTPPPTATTMSRAPTIHCSAANSSGPAISAGAHPDPAQPRRCARRHGHAQGKSFFVAVRRCLDELSTELGRRHRTERDDHRNAQPEQVDRRRAADRRTDGGDRRQRHADPDHRQRSNGCNRQRQRDHAPHRPGADRRRPDHCGAASVDGRLHGGSAHDGHDDPPGSGDPRHRPGGRAHSSSCRPRGRSVGRVSTTFLHVAAQVARTRRGRTKSTARQFGRRSCGVRP